jgi:hypothetical protein
MAAAAHSPPVNVMLGMPKYIVLLFAKTSALSLMIIFF